MEFFTGDALFQTHDNLEHLAMMEAVVGTRIDPYLVQSVNKMSTRGSGNAASKYALALLAICDLTNLGPLDTLSG